MPTALLAPLVLVVLALLVLLALRRHRASSSVLVGHGAATGSGMTPGEEIRLLRLQVETLTEALHTMTEGDAPRVVGRLAPVLAPVLGPVLEPVADGPAEVEEVTGTPAASPDEPPAGAVPDELPEQPSVKVSLVKAVPTVPLLPPPPARPDDDVARHYSDLSRCLADAGRLREAALAQWAADLRRLSPLVGDRARELHDALGTLAPVDTASALTGARAIAAGVLGPDVAVADLLGDAAHLESSSRFGRTPYHPGVASPEVLPDHVVRALEAILMSSAERGQDPGRLTVGLRCDLIAHVVPGRNRAEVATLVRDVLEPHEREAYDRELDVVGGAA